MSITIRAGGPDDHAVILSSWLPCYKHTSPFAKRIRTSIYYQWHHKIATAILKRGQVWVAHPDESPDIVLGYLVGEPGVVHFVFVKEEFRKLGIGRRLFDAGCSGATSFTHWTYILDTLIKKLPALTYDPYRI